LQNSLPRRPVLQSELRHYSTKFVRFGVRYLVQRDTQPQQKFKKSAKNHVSVER
jgi:hypothetical protein